MFFKIVVLKNFANFTGKHLCRRLFLIKLQALRTATLLKRDSSEICEIFKNTLLYWTSSVAVSDSFGFPVCKLKKRFLQRCFSVNFVKILRTSFDRTPPDDFFLSLSVNFKKFFRTSLSWGTSEKLPISCTSCRISTNRYRENLFQTFYARATIAGHSMALASHSKAFIYLKSLKIIWEEVN